MKTYERLMKDWHEKYPHLQPPTRYAIEAINRYIMHGDIQGSFITAVLANDLKNAVSNADNENINTIPALVVYLTWNVPAYAWGDYDNLDDYRARLRIQKDELQKS